MSARLASQARRPPLTGSAFVRTLGSLADVRVADAPDAFAQRLAGWLAWTDAFQLSAALGDGRMPPDLPGPGGHAALAADERELARVRAALARAIEEACGSPSAPGRGRSLPEQTRAFPAPNGSAETRAAGRGRAVEPTPVDAAVDFLAQRQRYTRCQRAMETQIAPLRRRLRASLAQRSPSSARLAELDAAMERVVGARERALLATVAARLEPRFDELRGAQDGASTANGPWLARFRQEMRGLLMAELDLRLQPVEGLLEACRTSLSACP